MLTLVTWLIAIAASRLRKLSYMLWFVGGCLVLVTAVGVMKGAAL